MAARKKAAAAKAANGAVAKAAKAVGRKRSNGAEDDGPEGFVRVENPHISGFWIPTFKGQSIRGIVQDYTTKDGVDGKPNVWANFLLTHDEVSGDVVTQDPDTKRKYKIEVGSGMMIGVSGAVLLARLRGREGKEVFVRYAGLGPKKKGKNQARLYDVFERAVQA